MRPQSCTLPVGHIAHYQGLSSETQNGDDPMPERWNGRLEQMKKPKTPAFLRMERMEQKKMRFPTYILENIYIFGLYILPRERPLKHPFHPFHPFHPVGYCSVCVFCGTDGCYGTDDLPSMQPTREMHKALV
jgi:hypothetical protein